MANAVANTKGAWTQLGADTTRRHSGLVVAVQGRGTNLSNAHHLLDIGIDPAGGISYTTVIGNIYCVGGTSETMMMNDPGAALLSIDIPSGSAIAARSQASVGNTSDQLDVVVFGF